jgi:hypothetical protein
MAPPICLLLAAAPLATTLRPGAIAVQSCIQSWTSAPGSRQPPRPTCPPAHLPAFDAIIKQRYAASSQTPPGRERARARSARHRTHASPALPASPNLWRYLAPPPAGAGKSALWWLGAGVGLTRRFDSTQHTSRALRRDFALSRRSDHARTACLLGPVTPHECFANQPAPSIAGHADDYSLSPCLQQLRQA